MLLIASVAAIGAGVVKPAHPIARTPWNFILKISGLPVGAVCLPLVLPSPPCLKTRRSPAPRRQLEKIH